ncbi:MAG TPA: hypothetical protein VF701_08425 [Thermoanaerobaculia bacterium]
MPEPIAGNQEKEDNMKKIIVTLAILTLAALPVLAGEWHTGQNNLCADCHTMHNSMSHTWTGTGTVTVATPSADGNWIKAGTTGAGDYLLKAENPNELCLSCHNGTVTFAPSVLAAKSVNDAANRSAGFLNEGGAEAHTGHSLGSTATAPGGTFANADGLSCVNCHTQHGRAGVYRNLGPRVSGAGAALTQPLYAMAGKQPEGMAGLPVDLAGAAAHATIDVFINAPGYVPNSGNAFAALYETGNVSYLKRAAAIGGIENASGTQCAHCHGSFHGAPADANIGGEAGPGTSFVHFNRHPVGGVVLGGTGSGGYSPLPSARYAANGHPQGGTSISKVKVYADDQTAFTDATPGCISCHKGHGNDQPFGLIFANRTLPGMGENGNLPVPTDGASTAIAQRGLCGQCHGQGN